MRRLPLTLPASLFALGLILVSAGAGWIYPPAGVVVLGSGLALFAVAIGIGRGQ